MKHFFIGAILSSLLFSSCNFMGKRVRGDGNVVAQSRSIDNFHGVDVGGAIEIFVTQDSTYSVKVEADNNLQEFIEVYKEGSRLHIHQRNNVNLEPSRDIKVYVSAPAFKYLGASGACSIKSQNRLSSNEDIDVDLSGASHADLDLKAPKVNVGLSGACEVTLKGETRTLDIDGSGSSNLKCFGLLTENADIELSGASEAEVYASVKLDIGISGASNVKYKGNAAVNSRASGASSINKVD